MLVHLCFVGTNREVKNTVANRLFLEIFITYIITFFVWYCLMVYCHVWFFSSSVDNWTYPHKYTVVNDIFSLWVYYHCLWRHFFKYKLSEQIMLILKPKYEETYKNNTTQPIIENTPQWTNTQNIFAVNEYLPIFF